MDLRLTINFLVRFGEPAIEKQCWHDYPARHLRTVIGLCKMRLPCAFIAIACSWVSFLTKLLMLPPI